MQDVTPVRGGIKTERGEHWWWPCTFYLQALIKPSQAGIDLSQNNPFTLSVPGHVGPLQLFMAECCASFRWDATTCPGKPVNCRLRESMGDRLRAQKEKWQMEDWLGRGVTRDRKREEGNGGGQVGRGSGCSRMRGKRKRLGRGVEKGKE